MLVLLEWNRDRKESTMWGRGTPAGSFIDGCVRKRKRVDMRERREAHKREKSRHERKKRG